MTSKKPAKILPEEAALYIEINEETGKDWFISIFSMLHSLGVLSVHFTCSSEKVHIQGMDPSNICMYDVHLTAAWFAKYTSIAIEPIEFSVSEGILHSIMHTKTDAKTMVFKMSAPAAEADTIDIEFTGSSTFDMQFSVPLTDVDYDEMVIPEIDYDVEFTLPSAKIAGAFSQLAKHGRNVNMEFLEESIHLCTEGSNGVVHIPITMDDLECYSTIEGCNIQLTFSMAYINKMCTNKLTTHISFYICDEKPIKIGYDLGNNSRVELYLAPKFSDDDAA